MDVVFDPCLPLVLEPASSTSAQELLSIDDAIAMWNALGQTQATRDDLPEAQRLPVRFEVAAMAFHGIYLDETGVLVINRLLADRKQRAITIAHEMGHAYGLWHVDRSSRISVMNKGNLSIVPLPGDSQALIAQWGACQDR